MASTNTSSAVRKDGKKDTLCRKPCSAEKMSYTKALLKLKQQEELISRGLPSAISAMKIDSDVFQDVLDNLDKLSAERQSFLDNLYKNLNGIILELKSLEHVAGDPKEMQKLDINKYKLKLLKFSQKMHDFKKSCDVESLIKERTILETELREFESNENNFDNAMQNITLQLLNRKKQEKGNCEYKDMQDFHSLIAKTGHTENWKQDDHLLFLKMRKKCTSIPTLVTTIQSKCPDLSAETIVNHEAWYKIYLSLREKQKSAVKEWRKQKELDKLRKTDDHKDSNEELLWVENESSKEEKVMIQNKTEASRIKVTRMRNSADSIRSKKKELIKKWKLEKENKRAMNEERLKIQLKLKQEAENTRRQNKQQKVQVLREQKRKESQERAPVIPNETSKERSKYNSELIKAFRKQDEEFTKRRLGLISSSRKISKSIEVARPKSSKVRTCSTLLNSTKVWDEKCKTMDLADSTPVSKLCYIKDVPRLYTKWRNQESIDVI